MTYEKMRDALRSAVAEVVMGTYTWIRDFDDTTVWFEVEHGGMCHNYQCSYTVGADDMIELGQDRVEVSEVTSWEPVAMALAFEPVAVTKSADEQQIVFGWANVSVEYQDMTMTLIGALAAPQLQILNFWFGSSKGSGDKTSLLANGT